MAGVVAVDIELAETLGAAFRGRMIASLDPDYDSARKLFNAMIDERPRLIAQCVDAADVIAAVNVAREAGLDVACAVARTCVRSTAPPRVSGAMRLPGRSGTAAGYR